MKIKLVKSAFSMIILLQIVIFVLTVPLRIPIPYVFCGIEFPVLFGAGNIDYVRLFEWIWIFLPLWFIGGYIFDEFIKNKMLVLLRFGSYLKWYVSLIKDMLFLQCVFTLGVYISNYFYGNNITFWPIALISVHGFFILTLLLLLRLILNSSVYSMFCVLLFEIFSFVLGDELGISSTFIPASWGMFYRSTAYGGNMTFDAVIIIFIEIIISILMIIICYYHLKSKNKFGGTKNA